MIGNLGPPLAVAQSAVYADVREGLVEATQVTSLESALSEDTAVDQRAHSNDFEWPSGQVCTSNEIQLDERKILHPELDFLDQQTCLQAEEHVFYGHDVIQVPLVLEPGGYRIDPSNTKLPKSCNFDKFACLSNVSLILSQREYEIVAQQMSQVESRTAEEILDRITSIKLRSMPKESKERSNQVQNQIGLLLTQVTSLEKELVSSYARIKASQSKQMKAEDQEAAIHERFLQLEATHRVTLKSLVQNEKELEREREQRILMQSNVDELKKLCEVAELELRTLKAVEQNQEEWKASKAALAQSRTENDILKQTLQKLKSELPKLREQCLMQAQNTISEAEKSLRSLHEETKYREGSLREDCQHERLQRQQITEKYHQVTGRIRVFCRVRPSTCLCKPSGDQSQALLFPRPGNILIVKTEKEYSFDEVLDSTSSQTDVYMRVAPIVSSFTDGHNACIMAYGQTGSGKTYTMLGDSSSPEMEGVIPRALRQVFSVVEKRKVSYKDTIRVSMVEIYNDQMLDLLQPQAERTKDSVTGSLVKAEADLTLRSVSKWSDVTEILTEGSSNRTIAATSMNLESSRSHTLLFLRLSSQCLASMDLKQSKLCLVDLAGSERISRSLVVGDRLKEAQHINKSLSALGDVIHALQHKAKHVPYRNSKLTFTLRDMLSGRAKTLLMLQLSPEEENCEETLCSLNFGARVSQVQLGAVQISVESGNIVHLQKEKATMMHTINCLENELKHLKSSRGDQTVPLKGEAEAKHRRKPLLEKAETQTITPSVLASSRRLSNSMTSEGTEFAHSKTENGAGTIVSSMAPQPHYQKSRSLAERRPSNFATSQSGRNLSLTHGDTTESNKLESKVSKATTKNTLVSAKSKTAFRSAPARYTKTNTAKHIAKETVLISSMREQVKSGRRPSKALSSSQKTTWK